MMPHEQDDVRSALSKLAHRVLADPGLFRDRTHPHVEEARALARSVLEGAGEADPQEQLENLTRAVFLTGGQRALLEAGTPFFSYDYLQDFELNAAQPWFPLPTRHQGTPRWQLLSKRVSVPFGVAASVLTVNARWVEFFARTGCDVNTYKTVRSSPRKPLNYPHWRFLHGARRPYPVGEFPDEFVAEDENWPADRSAFSTANSFGVPSEDPDTWQQDFAQAKETMGGDQVLLLSVIGTHPSGPRDRSLYDDFAVTARLAEQAGADIIELNLSCPNTLGPEGKQHTDLVCMSPDATRTVVEKVRESLARPDTQLLIKVSWMPRPQARAVVAPLLSEHLIQGVTGINTMQAAIETPSGHEVFPGRKWAGVSGAAIRNHALDFVAGMDQLRQESGPFTVIGVGGVLRPEHAHALLQKGADAVQSATGPFADPALGARVASFLNDEQPQTADAGTATADGPEKPVLRVLEALADRQKDKIEHLRHTTRLSEHEFEVAISLSVQNGLVSLKGRKGAEAELTPIGRLVLEQE